MSHRHFSLCKLQRKVALLAAAQLQPWTFLLLGKASSTLPKEHGLRCHRASGVTGGGWDRDNSEEWNRGQPWPKENGNDVEAAARLTGFNPFQETAKNFWEAQRSWPVLLSISLQFHSHAPLLQNPLSWVYPGCAPIWCWVHKHSFKKGSGKGCSSSGNRLFQCLSPSWLMSISSSLFSECCSSSGLSFLPLPSVKTSPFHWGIYWRVETRGWLSFSLRWIWQPTLKWIGYFGWPCSQA